MVAPPNAHFRDHVKLQVSHGSWTFEIDSGKLCPALSGHADLLKAGFAADHQVRCGLRWHAYLYG